MILNEQQSMTRDTARQFARRRLKPNSAAWDRDRTFPRDALLEMGRLGFLGMTVPAEWGGIGADVVSLAVALEEIAAGDAACATIMSGHNSVGFRLAAMATRIEGARQLTLHAAQLRDARKPCLKEACMAKLVASEMAEWVCSEAIQTLGGYGYINDFPVEQLYRDARVTRIYEGTNDIQQLVILRELMRS